MPIRVTAQQAYADLTTSVAAFGKTLNLMGKALEASNAIYSLAQNLGLGSAHWLDSRNLILVGVINEIKGVKQIIDCFELAQLFVNVFGKKRDDNGEEYYQWQKWSAAKIVTVSLFGTNSIISFGNFLASRGVVQWGSWAASRSLVLPIVGECLLVPLAAISSVCVVGGLTLTIWGQTQEIAKASAGTHGDLKRFTEKVAKWEEKQRVAVLPRGETATKGEYQKVKHAFYRSVQIAEHQSVAAIQSVLAQSLQNLDQNTQLTAEETDKLRALYQSFDGAVSLEAGYTNKLRVKRDGWKQKKVEGQELVVQQLYWSRIANGGKIALVSIGFATSFLMLSTPPLALGMLALGLVVASIDVAQLLMAGNKTRSLNIMMREGVPYTSAAAA